MPRRSAALLNAQPEVDTATPMALTPERQALADALAKVAALEKDIADTDAAISKAEQEHSAAYDALDVAERALERAKPRESTFTPGPRHPGSFWNNEEDYQAHVAEQAMPPIPISEARDAVARATDERDSTQRLVQFHKDRLQRLQSDLNWRRSAIRDGVRRVVRADPALAALASEAKRLATRAAAAAYAFSTATGGDVVQPASQLYGCTEPSSYRQDPAGWALSRAWQAALDSLQTDPATPLPMPSEVET